LPTDFRSRRAKLAAGDAIAGIMWVHRDMPSAQATQTEPAPAAAIDSDGLPAGERLSLAEMTRIMDVAATLRKERAIVDQQLNIDQIKAKLRERLMEAAKVSGDPVTEEEIAVAVEQYYDRLHEFREPSASFPKFLAHLWVLRTSIFKALAGIAAAVAVIWGLLAAGILPGEARDRRLAAEQRALLEERFDAVERAAAAVREVAGDDVEIEQEVAALVASARAASERKDAESLSDVGAKLEALQAELELEYTLVIASQPGGQTGLDRYWTDEQGTRVSGLFVFVEARDAEGKPVSVPIENRETGRIERVSRWAEQVPQEVYDRLKADKEADGVLDEREFGVKRRGVRQMEVMLPGADGAPLVRQGQLTSW
jgi:hypothetical protein